MGITSMLVLLAMGTADFDVAFSIREREQTVAPHCASLRKTATPRDPADQYGKGICLLYGLHGKANEQAGQAWLQRAAGVNQADAALALADYLQTQSPDAQREALQWYKVAEVAGDARAPARYQHLQARLEPEPPQLPDGAILDPTPQEMRTLYGAGYHCHRMAMGHRWCHDATDGL
jgi:hypothetical protein